MEFYQALEVATELYPSERKILKFIHENSTEEGFYLTNKEISEKLDDMPVNQVKTIVNSLVFMEYLEKKENVWIKGLRYRRVLFINNEY